MLLAALSVEKINTTGMIVAAIFVLAAGVTLIQGAMFACAVVMQK
jgi:hypothetical protein